MSRPGGVQWSFFRYSFLSIITRLLSSLQFYAVKVGKQLTYGAEGGPLCSGQIFSMNLNLKSSMVQSGEIPLLKVLKMPSVWGGRIGGGNHVYTSCKVCAVQLGAIG